MKTVNLHYPEPVKRFVSDWECAGVAVYPAAGAVSQALCFQRQSQIKRKERFRMGLCRDPEVFTSLLGFMSCCLYLMPKNMN